MRILAVDDDRINCLVMGGFLQHIVGGEDSYRVVSSGMEALRLVAESRFDVVFMDVMMPEMDGIECVRALREIYKRKGWEEALIVMVTACSDGETALRSRDAGAVGYMMKPIKKNQLVDWLQLAKIGGKNGESMGKSGDIGLTD